MNWARAKRHACRVGTLSLLVFALVAPVGAARADPAVETDVFEHSRMSCEITMPDGQVVQVAATGPATQAVYFEGEAEGAADDDDGDDREEVQTELLDLNLVGSSPMIGAVSFGLRPALLSLGEIEETTDSTPGLLDVPPFGAPGSTADSFFDLFLEIQIQGVGQPLYTTVPLRLGSVITHKPPASGDLYTGLEEVSLVDATGQPAGFFLGPCSYEPNPTVEVDVFDHSRLACEITLPDGQVEAVTATGPATQAVYFEGSGEGVAYDDDGDSREEVETEFLELNLVGFYPGLGAISFSLHPTLPSHGEIEETTNSTTGVLDVPPFGDPGSIADSYFNVSFEVQLGPHTLYTQTPVRFTSVITHKPPAVEDLYANLGQVSLIDLAGQQTGLFLGSCLYQPNLFVEIDVFDRALGTFEIGFPDGSVETVTASGSATQAVYFEGRAEGTAGDDDGDSRDEVPTEMREFNLVGFSPALGPVSFSLHPTLPSLGEIEETTNSTPDLLDLPPFGAPGSTADSYINLALSVQVGVHLLYTEQPQHFRSVITHKPPAAGDLHANLETAWLVDATGQRTDYFLGSASFLLDPGELADADADGTPDASDNCSYLWNPDQTDTNEDEIGDACQCGDVDHNGVPNTTDALLIARGQVTEPADLARCDVSGDLEHACNTTDALLIARGQAPATPETQTCPAYTGE